MDAIAQPVRVTRTRCARCTGRMRGGAGAREARDLLSWRAMLHQERPSREIGKTTPVGTIVTRRPAAARVFERHGIDYCCGGRASLAEACAPRRLDPAAMLREIEQAVAPADAIDWASLSPAAMCDAIEERYHRALDRELPRLEALAAKVARAHAARHPVVVAVSEVVQRLSAELTRHMAKEEGVLFPMIRANGTAPPPPIAVMLVEHEDAGEALRTLRRLTNDYELPEGACNSYRALYAGLAELEHELLSHMHVENNILFPRVSAR
jgi:regulator of cell morphogenesis and NO signaling